MLLTGFGVSQFQSYETEQLLDLDPHVTLLAGRNNVGKSALLRALQLPRGGQEGARPGVALSYRFALTPHDLDQPDDGTQRLKTWLFPDTNEVELAAAFKPAADGQAWTEPLLTSIRVKGAVATGPVNTQFGWEGGDLHGSVTGVAELTTLIRSRIEHAVYLGPRRIHQGLRSMSASTSLQPTGENLTDVLFFLSNNRRKLFAELERIVRLAFPEVEAVSVQIQPDQGANTQGEPYVLFASGAEVRLKSCGTGLEQIIALAAGILTAPTGSLFLIDEPQAYLHPHAERSLLEVLLEHSEHQYVIATHSHLLLGACPIEQVRLVFVEGGHSRIAADLTRAQLLHSLGITAADLWLADSIVWVEGPTEVSLLSFVADRVLSPTERQQVAINAMPIAASRFLARKKGAEEAYEFCARASEAVSPLPTHMCFLFDADEKSEEFKARIGEVSGGRARFLEVRELENLLLDPGLIAAEVRAIAREVQAEVPEASAVVDLVERLLAATDDYTLYPRGADGPGGHAARVRASRLLDQVWFTFLRSEYDKVRDGLALARRAETESDAVWTSLREILEEAVGRTAGDAQP